VTLTRQNPTPTGVSIFSSKEIKKWENNGGSNKADPGAPWLIHCGPFLGILGQHAKIQKVRTGIKVTCLSSSLQVTKKKTIRLEEGINKGQIKQTEQKTILPTNRGQVRHPAAQQQSRSSSSALHRDAFDCG